jgi:hypothetical protein
MKIDIIDDLKSMGTAVKRAPHMKRIWAAIGHYYIALSNILFK